MPLSFVNANMFENSREKIKITNHWILFAIFFLIVLIKAISFNSFWVEKYYSTGIYSFISIMERAVTGWIPFSVGDFLYLFLVVIIIIGLIKGIKKIIILKIHYFKKFPLKRYLIKGLIIYIVFNILWGINYHRQGIGRQLDLDIRPYNLTDLKFIQKQLLIQTNISKTALQSQDMRYPSTDELFHRAKQCYYSSKKVYNFINYHPSSLKSSLYGEIGDYLGFSGYYNPFTGEAQVNTTIPKFILPYTTCHEIAHQLGYAKENEANFVSFLTATSTNDTLFRYSAYLDLFVYATHEIAIYDSNYAKETYHMLSLPVKKDLQEVREFWRHHQNPVEPIITWLYGKYLKANQQPRGIQSYNEVTADLIAYYKKYKKI